MKNKSLLILGLIAAAGAGIYFYAKKRLVTNSKILFKGISYSKGKFYISFRVQNPTDTTGSIKSLTGEVIVENKTIANFSSFTEIKIQPNQETIIKVTASPAGGLLSLILTKGWLKAGVTYTIKGRGSFDGVFSPFEFRSKLI